MVENKKTIGQISTELAQEPKQLIDLDETQQQRDEEYIKNVLECMERGKKSFPDDFYIVVMHNVEHLMKNVFRKKYFPTLHCPTPTWNQVVYKYHCKDEHIEFLWTIPDPQTCKFFVDNAIHTPVDERQLLQYILDFHDGTLDKKAIELNEFKPDVILDMKEVE